jgi:hypothetical protein
MTRHGPRSRYLMSAYLLLALVLAFPAASSAATRCYSSLDDSDVTITDDTNDIDTLVMKVGNETIVMRTESGGTGSPFRQADEPDGTTHLYRYIGDMLIMDTNVYYLGCPGGHTWVNDKCSSVLITQVDAYAEVAQFYYSEEGLPITTCLPPAAFKDGEVITVKCTSGRVLRVDAHDYPTTLKVNGESMRSWEWQLPCK